MPLRTKVRDSLAIYPISLSQQPHNRNKSVIPTPCAKRREAKWVDGIIANHLVHLPLLLQRGGTHRRRHLKHPITATKKSFLSPIEELVHVIIEGKSAFAAAMSRFISPNSKKETRKG